MKLSRSVVNSMAAPAPDWRWRVWMPNPPMSKPRSGSGAFGALGRAFGAVNNVLSGSFFSGQGAQLGAELGGNLGEFGGAIGAEIGGTAGRFVDQVLGGAGGLGGFIGPQQRIIAEQVSFSYANTGQNKRFGGGKSTYYPDMTEISGASLTFYEDVNYSVTRYLFQWKGAIFGDDGSYGLPGDYKRDITLECFSYTNDSSPVLVGTLKGCWPTDQSPLDLNYTSEGRVTVQCQFSVDSSFIK